MTFSNCAMEILLKWLYYKNSIGYSMNLLGMWLLKWYVPFPVSDSRSNSGSLIVYLHFWTYSTQFYGFYLD